MTIIFGGTKMKRHNDTVTKDGKIYTRQDMEWHIALRYLDDMHDGVLLEDETFSAKLNDLRDYVCSKLELPNQIEPSDVYVMVEQRDGKN